MTQELMAYFIDANGKVHPLSTEGLRLTLEQVVQGNLAEKHEVSPSNAAVYAFLHVLKSEMRAARSLPSATEQCLERTSSPSVSPAQEDAP